MKVAGVHYFDLLVLLVLLNGFLVGWNRGLAGEWPRLVMWLLIVGLGRLVSPLMADLAQGIGLTRMGGGLCGLSWTVVIMRWIFESATRDSRKEAPKPPRLRQSLTRPLGGALSGVLRYSSVLLVAVTLLAILPGGVSRFTEFRRSVLHESLSGAASEIYWASLSHEQDEEQGRTKGVGPAAKPDRPMDQPAVPAEQAAQPVEKPDEPMAVPTD